MRLSELRRDVDGLLQFARRILILSRGRKTQRALKRLHCLFVGRMHQLRYRHCPRPGSSTVGLPLRQMDLQLRHVVANGDEFPAYGQAEAIGDTQHIISRCNIAKLEAAVGLDIHLR